MTRPVRRAVIRLTPEELAAALDLAGSVSGIRFDYMRDTIDVLVCSETLDPVELMCEPPVVDRATVTRPNRFRLAWLSARRRAQRYAEILEDQLEETGHVPITLVLDETNGTVTWAPDNPDHTNDLHPPSTLLGRDGGGRPYFDQARPWWLCHVTGLVHFEGPCILRTDPADLRFGSGPIHLTPDVRATITANRRPTPQARA